MSSQSNLTGWWWSHKLTETSSLGQFISLLCEWTPQPNDKMNLKSPLWTLLSHQEMSTPYCFSHHMQCHQSFAWTVSPVPSMMRSPWGYVSPFSLIQCLHCRFLSTWECMQLQPSASSLYPHSPSCWSLSTSTFSFRHHLQTGDSQIHFLSPDLFLQDTQGRESPLCSFTSNEHQSRNGAGPKPTAWNSTWISHTGGWEPCTWTFSRMR